MNCETKSEAKKRVEQALNQIEAAQGLLAEACGKVSRVEGIAEHWLEISKMHDQVKATWHRLNMRASDPSLDLDSDARRNFKAQK